MGENTLRALTSDLAYLQAWSLAATGRSLTWPAPEALLLKFVAHHLWDPEKRLQDPDHGMPLDVEDKLRLQGLLRSIGPHAPDTVRRRLATWSTLTKWRGLDGFFGSPALKSAIRLAVRARPRPRKRKSAKAVTGDILSRLIATCTTGSLRDIRDSAILMVAFASGGRRRSEIAGLGIEQLQQEEPIQIDGASPLLSLSIHLGRTKTSGGDSDEVVYLSGRPVDALSAWLAAAKIEKGSVFRAIDRWGNVSRRPLDPKAINDIVKHRAELAKLDPTEFSAHGLRSGYLTEAANCGIPLPEAMEQSRHRSVQQASEYYNSATRRSGRAARLMD
jgi:integrase